MHTIMADWKDMDGLADQFVQVLKDMKCSVIEHPLTKGSSTYGFLVNGDYSVIADDMGTLVSEFSCILKSLGYSVIDLGEDTDTYWLEIDKC